MLSVRAKVRQAGLIYGFLVVYVLVFSALLAAGQDTGGFSIDNSPLPAPTGFVNDFAGVIDEASKAQLEATLKNLRDTTSPSVEIAVAVVRTTGDRPISDYSLAVARGWKIGSKEDDNPSALLFVAIDDRKYFTQISRNLEDELPDSVVGSLQRQYLVPEFRKGNYGKGIADMLNAYVARIRDAGNAPVNANVPKRDTGGGSGLAAGGFGSFTCCLVILIVLVVLAVSRMGRKKSGNDRDRWGGGGFGGGGMGSALPWVIGSILSSSGGSSSSSGSSDWGSSSGGGSDWGGFGGGGDFGGGGSGGDW